MNPHFGLPSRKNDPQEDPTEQITSPHRAYRDQDSERLPIPGATNPYAVPSRLSQPNDSPYAQTGSSWPAIQRPIDRTGGQHFLSTDKIESIPTHPLGEIGSFPPGPPRPPRPPQRPRRNTLLIVGIVVVVLVALAGGGSWAMMHGLSPQPTKKVGKTASTPTTPPVQVTQAPRVSPVSPLLFGTNLELYDTKDQALTSAKTRQLLQQIDVRMIRMPMRNDGTMEPEIQGAQMIKDLGATPLVILHGDARVSAALQDDTQMIQEMNKIFGNSLVYYEYGNEQDLNGVGASKYTASWNRVVPQLKKIANNAHFIGPVGYQYDQEYIQYFLQNANPRPNEISWHEYTCDKSWAKDTCLQHIDNWSKHISNARAMMKATIGSELPIMITEWNYAPNPSLSDGKITDAEFMNAWTTKAFQVLAANRIFASMIYAATHPVFPLVEQNATLSAQGSIFKQEYQKIITNAQAPAALSGTDATAQSGTDAQETGNESTVFGFEQSGDNTRWTSDGKGITRIGGGSVARTGNGSLQITLAKLQQSDTPGVFVNVAGSTPRAGQSVAGYLNLTSNAVSFSARIVVTDQSGKQHLGEVVALTPGKWNRVAFTLPASFSGQAQRIGFQFSSPGDNITGADVYLDDVGWN
jgi:hypothetical protein